MNINAANTPQRTLFTISQFCDTHPAFTPGGIRYAIHRSVHSGLGESGAIIRIGSRVYIDEGRFFNWVDSLQPDGQPPRTKRTVPPIDLDKVADEIKQNVSPVAACEKRATSLRCPPHS